MSTKIEWTEETWNPVVGCSRVSPGCDHCYAIGVAHRAMQPAHVGLTIKRPGEPIDWTGTVRIMPERLGQPLRWRKPRRVFVNSMSDLFHPDVPADFVAQVFDSMGLAPQHTFQVLTKRPQLMATMLHRLKAGEFVNAQGLLDVHPQPLAAYLGDWPLPNVWLGTSIESDRYAFRADHLRATPAAVRWLSLEPLLGPLPSLNLDGIDWVVVGGESGPGARPMHPDWARDIRDRCVAAGVPFFFKQWGDWAPDQRDVIEWQEAADPEGINLRRVGKKAAGRVLDGRTWDEYPGGAR